MQRDKLFTASNAFGLLIGHLGIQARWNERKVGWDPVNLTEPRRAIQPKGTQ